MSLLLNDGSPAAIRRAVAKAPVKRSMKMLRYPAIRSQRWERAAPISQSALRD
ncbi:hypothetical protein SAMN03159288_00392 [Rhizobium sp. NFACC06-2]|nr:hypothetical protein SAMN03159288_00392 [Rhizobium sp. NFACC06-2]